MQSDIYYFSNHKHNYYAVLFRTIFLNNSTMLNVLESLSNKDYNFTNSREYSTMSEPMDLEEEMPDLLLLG